jgi:hypothetical protein
MPTSAFGVAARAERTGEVLLTLLTLSHPSLAQPIRVTSDAVQTVSRGQSFVPYKFAATWAPSSETAPPVARLAISNIDRVLVESLRALPLEPALDVLAVQRSQDGLELRAADYDVMRVTGDLVVNILDREPFPAARVLPSTVPGAF